VTIERTLHNARASIGQEGGSGATLALVWLVEVAAVGDDDGLIGVGNVPRQD
jgi:hypothetical protein